MKKILASWLQEQKKPVLIYGKEDKEWSVDKRGSPGNTEELADMLEGSVMDASEKAIMAVKITSEGKSQKVVGVAICNTESRTIEVCEFIDTDRFENFEVPHLNN